MHELSIANTILNIVLNEKMTKNLSEIKTIGLKIGALSGVFPDALEFGFDAIKKDTALEHTRLKIMEAPVKALCENCSNKFTVSDLIFACPECHSASIKLEQGQEMDIAYLEVDDEMELANE